MSCVVAVMGEISFGRIGSGLTSTIHDDGSVSTVPDKWCDCCELTRNAYGGFEVKDATGEKVMWLCSQCRA